MGKKKNADPTGPEPHTEPAASDPEPSIPDGLVDKLVPELVPQLSQIISSVVKDEMVKAAPKPEPKPEVKPEQVKETGTEERIREIEERFQGELKRRDDELNRERMLNAVRTASSKVSWFDPEDAVRELSSGAKFNDGQFTYEGQTEVGGVKVTRSMSLDEAAAALAKRKPYLVKADVKSGSGASGIIDEPTGSPMREITTRDLREGKVSHEDLKSGKVKLKL